MGGGMGAGPPISPPGRSGMDASSAASDIASQRGSFGRELATRQHLSPQEYQALAQERRSVATQYAQAVRAGRKLPAHSDRDIRTALGQDIDSWRSEFKVGRTEWQGMRDAWIVDRASLTPQQWAQRRADWFNTRDAWIAKNKAYAQSRAH